MNLDDLLAPTGDTFNYKKLEVGEDVQGVITSTPDVFPHNVYGTDKQQTTKAGKPMWKIRVNLKTKDGDKKLYLEKSAYWSFVHAVKGAGLRTFEELKGYAFQLKREADTPSKTEGFAASKNFEIKVKKLDK